MNTKRGQAALEFLTTYGWAFLVILVMIGALAYFGVLDPARFLPQRCQFGAEMSCERFALDSNTGKANFELRNALPTHAFVTNIEWGTPDDESWYRCQSAATVNGVDVNTTNATQGAQFNRETSAPFVCADNNTLPTWDSIQVGEDLNNTLVSGDKQRVRFRITYNEGTSADTDYSKYLYGEIYANVR